MSTNLKPVLKWAGGKYKIREKILDKFPERFASYWEPFMGGASIATEIYKTTQAHIFVSDVNDDLTNFYTHLRDNTQDLIDVIKRIHDKFNTGDKKHNYYVYREAFNKAEAGHSRSALFYFLNKTSFNGLTRYNAKGGYNVPYGKRDFSMDIEKLTEFAFFLQSKRVFLTQRSFEQISPNEGDLVYFDPPYHPINETSSFTSYQQNPWNEETERSLKRFCDSLNAENVHFILSNNDVPFIRDLFAGYNFNELDVRKSVGAHADTRKHTAEVLITNY